MYLHVPGELNNNADNLIKYSFSTIYVILPMKRFINVVRIVCRHQGNLKSAYASVSYVTIIIIGT